MLDKFRDHLIEAQLLKDEKFTRLGFVIIGVVFLLLIADIIYLNSILISNRALSESTPIPSKEPIIPPPSIPQVATSVPESPTPIPSPSGTSAPQYLPVSNPAVKEYFIPLGTGTSKAGDWEDVTGVQATVDFRSIKILKKFILKRLSQFLLPISPFPYGSLIRRINTRYGFQRLP